MCVAVSGLERRVRRNDGDRIDSCPVSIGGFICSWINYVVRSVYQVRGFDDYRNRE